MFQYDFESWLILIALGFINVVSTYAKITAYQYERPGFVTLLAYIGLIYAFIGDVFIFHENFAIAELFGILIVLALNLSLVFSKLQICCRKKPERKLKTKTSF